MGLVGTELAPQQPRMRWIGPIDRGGGDLAGGNGVAKEPRPAGNEYFIAHSPRVWV